MGIFKKNRFREKKKVDTNEEQDVFRKFTKELPESFIGICPFCGSAVTFETEESIEKLTVTCKSCKRVIFYLDKVHTPYYERNIGDLQGLSKLDFD